jgi:hypothetical protein
MSTGFTEDEMRRALGLTATHSSPTTPPATAPAANEKPRAAGSKPKRRRSPKLRVTLRVSKEFEGATVQFTHDADTLSQFDAEQEAKTLAKKEKYRFFEVVSIKSIV